MSNEPIDISAALADPKFWEDTPKERQQRAIKENPAARERLREYEERGKEADGNATEGRDAFGCVDSADLADRQVEPLVMVVDRILPAAALTIAAAKPKTGKSTLVLELCHSVITGEDFLDEFGVTQGKVVYSCPDDNNLDRATRNWNALADGGRISGVKFNTNKYTLLPDGIPFLENMIATHDPKLLVIDSYTQVRAGKGRGVDIEKAEMNDLRALSELAYRTKAAILLIHHSPKTKYGDPMEASAGTWAMGGGADARWSWLTLGSNERLIHVDGRDMDRFAFVYSRNSLRKLFHVISSPCAEHWEKIREFVGSFETRPELPFTRKDLAQTFQVSPRWANKLLNEWYESGVVTGRRGDYKLTPEVLAALDSIQRARQLTDMEPPRGVRNEEF